MGPVGTELPGGSDVMEPSWIDEWHRVKPQTEHGARSGKYSGNLGVMRQLTSLHVRRRRYRYGVLTEAPTLGGAFDYADVSH